LTAPAAARQEAPGPAPAQSLPEPELALYCPHRPPPRYPATARRLGQEGVVDLLVALSAVGRVTEVRVVRTSGSARLDAAAVAAVRGWRCEPARVGGVAVAASARQRIRFSLR
jgi:protein TonB